MNNIALFIIGEKGYYTLDFLIKKKLHRKISAVISDQDRGVEKDYYKETEKLSLNNNMNFFNRKDFNNLSSVNNKTNNIEFAIAISWKWLINDLKTIVLHDSLLPNYRGFNPLVTALISGDEKIGVSAILANEKIDEGDIILQESTNVIFPCKISTAIKKIIPLYCQIVENILVSSFSDFKLIKQDESKATYSLWRDEKDYFIDWDENAKIIERFINAVGSPYKGARFNYEGRVIVVEDAIAVDDLKIINRTSGKIFKLENGCPIVVCGEGLLLIRKAIDILTGEKIVFNKIRVRLC